MKLKVNCFRHKFKFFLDTNSLALVSPLSHENVHVIVKTTPPPIVINRDVIVTLYPRIDVSWHNFAPWIPSPTCFFTVTRMKRKKKTHEYLPSYLFRSRSNFYKLYIDTATYFELIYWKHEPLYTGINTTFYNMNNIT